jgi:hypothetical protein
MNPLCAALFALLGVSGTITALLPSDDTCMEGGLIHIATFEVQCPPVTCTNATNSCKERSKNFPNGTAQPDVQKWCGCHAEYPSGDPPCHAEYRKTWIPWEPVGYFLEYAECRGAQFCVNTGFTDCLQFPRKDPWYQCTCQ